MHIELAKIHIDLFPDINQHILEKLYFQRVINNKGTNSS